jgi:hypothetical protein
MKLIGIYEGLELQRVLTYHTPMTFKTFYASALNEVI